MEVPLLTGSGSDPMPTGKVVQGTVLVDPSTGAKAIPTGVFEGHRAMTVQDYTEANVKNGLQYEWAQRFDLAAAGQAGDRVSCVLMASTKKVLVKARIISFTGTEIQARVYSGSVYSGGTNGEIFNLRPVDGIPTTVTIKENVTVTTIGNQAGAPTFGLGGTGPGQTVVGSFAVRGVERVVFENGRSLLQIRNFDNSACKVAVYVTWYEGEPDLSPIT